MTDPQVKLYEISALVNYVAVIAATSEAEALEHVSTWRKAWGIHTSADLIGVTDVEIVNVRERKASDVDDEAHDVTSAARRILNGQ